MSFIIRAITVSSSCIAASTISLPIWPSYLTISVHIRFMLINVQMSSNLQKHRQRKRHHTRRKPVSGTCQNDDILTLVTDSCDEQTGRRRGKWVHRSTGSHARLSPPTRYGKLSEEKQRFPRTTVVGQSMRTWRSSCCCICHQRDFSASLSEHHHKKDHASTTVTLIGQ